jgi:plastocyanin
MRRVAVVIAVAGVASVAGALPAAAAAKTKTVYEDAPPSAQKVLLTKYAATVNAFFLTKVTINQGDTLKFVNEAFHDVDFPGTSKSDLPLLVPGATVSGDKDAAGNLFWFNGKVPSLGFNPALFSPIGSKTYNGSARIDSGLPVGSHSPDALKVTFTKPGRYRYFCDIHAGMIGFVIVRAKGKPVRSAKQDAAAQTRFLTAQVEAAKKLPQTKLAKNHVSLGLSLATGQELYAMFPSKLTVKTGTVVTFSMSSHSREVHTASFGPAAYLNTLANSLNGPAFAQQVFYPSSPPPGPVDLGPTSHGNGFANTGGLDRDSGTALPPSGAVKFTTPGTYNYVCLVHPFMHGTIVVTP